MSWWIEKVFVYGKLHGNVSAAQLEVHCKVNICVKRFLGLGLAWYPDEKTIYQYRLALLKSGRWEELLDRCLEQLAVKGYQIKEGVKIPAITITDRLQSRRFQWMKGNSTKQQDNT